VVAKRALRLCKISFIGGFDTLPTSTLAPAYYILKPLKTALYALTVR